MRTAHSLTVTRAIRRPRTAGNFLSGGDFTAVLDLTPLSLIEETLTKLEGMGLSTGTKNSLVGRLEGAVKLMGVEVGNENGVLALMDAFKRGVLHQFDRDQLTAEQRDELLADANLIILGITRPGVPVAFDRQDRRPGG